MSQKRYYKTNKCTGSTKWLRFSLSGGNKAVFLGSALPTGREGKGTDTYTDIATTGPNRTSGPNR